MTLNIPELELISGIFFISRNVGYLKTTFIVSVICRKGLWSGDVSSFTSSKFIFTGTLVISSSGQVKFTVTVSPTDFPLILRNKYSTSKVGEF